MGDAAKPPPLCPACGGKLGRSFTKGDWVCLPCSRTFEESEVGAERFLDGLDEIAEAFGVRPGRKGDGG